MSFDSVTVEYECKDEIQAINILLELQHASSGTVRMDSSR